MYLLFDIGGTKTRVALSKDGKDIEEPVIANTPKDFEQGMELFSQILQKLVGNVQVQGAAGSMTGPLNKEKSGTVRSPNLPQWAGKPLKQRLENIIKAPVLLENDGALVGLGEATRGAGQGKDIVAYLTVSTGVGGARIVRQRIDESAQGFEPGHQIINVASNDICGCGTKGDLEIIVSGGGVEKKTGKQATEFSQDDPLWEELAEWLAVGLNNTIVHWSPDIVVLGGSMMTGNPRIPLESVKKHLKEKLTIYPESPELALAQLGDFSGLYGALILLQQQEQV
ncbi:MAG: ROK family protein [Candidatus Yanofskybacteria bacterium]|nr:ROK family protein [Candidatus Yanofskybacteria bacterium]